MIALLLQGSMPGLVAGGETVSGEEGLLGVSQEAPLRKDESGRDNQIQISSRGASAHFSFRSEEYLDTLISFPATGWTHGQQEIQINPENYCRGGWVFIQD